MKKTLWNRNYSLLIIATVMGAAGGIAGGFALSFLVYEETGSTLASALLIAIEVIPGLFVPLLASPFMDRLPRKPMLVAGDAVNGALYALAGLYLMSREFSYVGYLLFSLLLASLSAFDSLAYQSIFPKLIQKGFEDKGYTVSAMVYPVMQVVIMPVAAWLYSSIGVGRILLVQGALSLLAALVESRIRLKEQTRLEGNRFSVKLWIRDISEAWSYLKKEKGLRSIFTYMAVTNGVGNGYSTLLVAFFSGTQGFTMAMYSFFAVAEFAGRTIGGITRYNFKIPEKKRFSFAFAVYQIYELADAALLWLPYPLMLGSRALCGFLGINSATMREAAVQSYIKDEYRARVNAFNAVVCSAAFSVLSLAIGALGEAVDLRVSFTICGLFASAVCWATIWRDRKHVKEIYNRPTDEA